MHADETSDAVTAAADLPVRFAPADTSRAETHNLAAESLVSYV